MQNVEMGVENLSKIGNWLCISACIFAAVVADFYYQASDSVGFLLSGIMILYNDDVKE